MTESKLPGGYHWSGGTLFFMVGTPLRHSYREVAWIVDCAGARGQWYYRFADYDEPKQGPFETVDEAKAACERDFAAKLVFKAMTNHDNLISERGAEYGESWRETGRFLAEHRKEIAAMGENSFAYVMMHNKLMRALRSPGNKDHYDDLIGYAKLVLSNL